MIHADEIGKTVQAYLRRHPADADRLAPLTAALGRPGDVTSRKTLPGHVTCSAVVLDDARRVLHIRHNALDLWLRPGGHLESDDISLVDGALREVVEETGILADQLSLADALPIDIDVHSIPTNPAKNEPDHQHFDIRYIFFVTGNPIVALQAEEVHDFAWLPMAKLPERIRDKVSEAIFRPQARAAH